MLAGRRAVWSFQQIGQCVIEIMWINEMVVYLVCFVCGNASIVVFYFAILRVCVFGLHISIDKCMFARYLPIVVPLFCVVWVSKHFN